MARSAQISSLHREQLADIAEFDRTEAWRGDGAVSMVGWVTAQCGVSTSTARQWVRSGTNLESLPCLAEGLASGALSLDLVEPLAEVASAETDGALREASTQWSVRQARDLAAWHRARQEAETQVASEAQVASEGQEGSDSPTVGGAGIVESAAREFRHRTLRFNDTRRSLWVAFTKDDYAVVKSALVGRVAAEVRRRRTSRDLSDAGAGGADRIPRAGGTERGGGTGDRITDTAGTDGALGYVPYDQRLYDALLHLFFAGSSPSPGRRRAFRPRVVVHAPLELLLGIGNVEVAEIAGVGPVAAEVARRLACDADVTLSVEGRNGRILDQGRARRDPTVAQRIEIDRRDKGCRFPGCTYSEFTDVHHIRHWTKGGLTNLDNLVTLCGRHHDAVHELGWAMAGDADEALTFTSPHGRAMTSVPSPTWRPRTRIVSAPDATDRHRPLRC